MFDSQLNAPLQCDPVSPVHKKACVTLERYLVILFVLRLKLQRVDIVRSHFVGLSV